MFRLIHREKLPAQRRGDRYHFDRVELDEWARRRGKVPATSATPKPSLRRALHQGGIHYGIRAANRDDALRAIAALPGERVALAQTALFEMLLAREQLAPTTVGHGFALPHPREPSISGVELEYLHLCMFEQPVDFGALDGRPVHTALLLLSPDVETHLQLLARVALALRDADLCSKLEKRAPREAIDSRLDALFGLIESRESS